MWVATQGKAGIKQQTAGGACPKALQRNIVCTLGTFSLFLDGDFHLAIRRQQVAAEPILGIRTREGAVNGAELVFDN